MSKEDVPHLMTYYSPYLLLGEFLALPDRDVLARLVAHGEWRSPRSHHQGRLRTTARALCTRRSIGRDGTRFPGALMVMEKRPAGFDASTGDWRSSMIMKYVSLQRGPITKRCIELRVEKSLKTRLWFF